ncbi:MAG: hypothetical protein WCT32_01705 [Patescibacteria group bacterium]|jgi:hypothetical protein
MPLPTWDVFIGLIFLVGIAYGFILRRDKTIATLCSVYIGLVIATNFSQTLFDFFNGNKVIANQLWIRSSTPLPIIAIILFLISIIFVSGAINSSNNRGGDISPIEVFVYSTLTVALIISSVLNFMPEEMRLSFLKSSHVANLLFRYHSLMVMIPPISLVVLNFKRK